MKNYEGISEEDAAKKVLEVTSSPKHKENVRKLKEVDRQDSPVEWITSVSMLTEGWDVKNVFQIVPHEERAFNSKLLIAQVLGRGLRIPEVYLGQKPVVAETENPTNYAEKYDLNWLKKLLRNSLDRIGESGDQISDENRQRIYQAFGVIHRSAAKAVRYRMSPKALIEVNTRDRNRNSVGYAAIKRGDATIFYDDLTLKLSDEESLNFLKDLEGDESRPVSAMEKIENIYYFKTTLNLVISDHKPERLFIRRLISSENAKIIDSWLKSTDQDFYPIEYSWKKGEHPKRGRFNPDFFIKIADNILVVEIKGDEEIREPSDENKAKYKAAKNHFKALNEQQDSTKYYFNFLTPEDYDYYFDHLKKGNFDFNSKLDAELAKNGV